LFFGRYGGRYGSSSQKKITGRIFEKIPFLEEVFGDKADADIPNVPVIELAKCFELSHPRTLRPFRGRRKHWPLWK
jgi:hypothetical protein